MDKFQAFGKNIRYEALICCPPYTASLLAMAAELDEYRRWLTQAYVSATFTPFAARTQQYVKEQLGQADEKVGWLPSPPEALPVLIPP
jgi:hypothetical protein